MRNLLGGKGANLAEMSNLGLPVPPGLHDHDRGLHPFLRQWQDLSGRAGSRRSPQRARRASRWRSAQVRRSRANPLLVSVRSGARVSMPGMMDTVLNLGLNDETVAGPGARAAATSASPMTAIAASSRCTAQVVLGIEHHHFEELIENHKEDRGARSRHRARRRGLEEMVAGFKAVVAARSSASRSRRTREEQLWGAIGAVFGSWMNPRAVTYRRLHDIPAEWGTAVNVQAMVFGNMGDDCATGVAFTRNPSTGANEFYGEYPGQRAGRGCRRRHPHAAASDHRRQEGQRLRAAGDGRGDARSLRRARRRCAASSKTITATCRTSSSRCSAASSGCCRPAPASARPRRR